MFIVVSVSYPLYWDFPGGASGKEPTCQRRRLDTWVQSLDQEDPLEKEIATHSSILAWKSHGRRKLVGYSPRGRKEADMTE